MKKLLLTMTALLATAGAMAQGTAFDVPQNFARLTADELNAVTSSKRIAIECTQESSYNQFYNGTANKTSISSTTLPENVVFEWVKVDGEETFNVKRLTTGQYLTHTDIKTFAESGTADVAKFKALSVTGNIDNSHYTADGDAAYRVRLAISPNFSTWFNFNGSVLGYNNGTGVWTVQHVLDLSDYYKLTLTIVKGSETTNSVVYMKTGEDIVAPDYSSEGYVSDYTTIQKTSSDEQTVTITYTLDPKTQLQALISRAKTYAGGTLVGEYSEASITALANAITTAEGKLNGTVTAEDVETLQAAIGGLTRNMPVAGKFYKFFAWKPGNENKVAFAKTNNNIYWGLNETPAAVWVFEDAGEGEYYLKNLSTGCYMDNFAGYGAQAPLIEGNTQTVSVVPSNDGRKVGIKVGNNNDDNKIFYLDRDQEHADANGCKPVCRWEDSAIPTGDNRKWLINEVDPSTIKHTITMGAAGWATVVLGFNAAIPTNAEVYVVESTTSTEATLKPVTGVLGANTGVLVKAAEGTVVDFAYSAESATVTSSGMLGTLYDKNTTPAAGKTCYVLSMPEGKEAGFYKATLNQENNAAFKNNANKAYLSIDTPVDGEAPSLSFVFDTETGIQGIDAAKAEGAIYDLSGRRVKAATKGIYIINGKKVIK